MMTDTTSWAEKALPDLDKYFEKLDAERVKELTQIIKTTPLNEWPTPIKLNLMLSNHGDYWDMIFKTR